MVRNSVPIAGEGKRGRSGHLAYLLRQAAGTVRVRLDRALVDVGVTLPQFSVMTMLDTYPGASSAEIARVALLTPQTVGTIIGNLERDELVRRHPHPVHGRIQQLELTRNGVEVLAQCRARVHKTEEALTRDVSASEEEVIRRWLIQVALQE